MNQTTLNVSEIFYSIQGEGSRAGSANVFIRLQGCKAKDACYAGGVRCDTEFESGRPMTLTEIADWIDANAPEAKAIIWTGGEPAQQLTHVPVEFFKAHGFYQAIETSGLYSVPTGIDYVCVSPKVAEHVIAKNFSAGVDELRYVRHAGQDIPTPSVTAKHYFLSPHFDGDRVNVENLRHCIDLVKRHPKWTLSIQLHKLLNVL